VRCMVISFNAAAGHWLPHVYLLFAEVKYVGNFSCRHFSLDKSFEREIFSVAEISNLIDRVILNYFDTLR